MKDKPFSIRMGLVHEKLVQVNELDQAARIAIYNVVGEYLKNTYTWTELWNILGTRFFKERHDMIFVTWIQLASAISPS